MLDLQEKLTARLRSSLSPLRYWPRTLRIIWDAAPRWTPLWAALLIVQGVLPAASVYLIKLLVDSLVEAKASGGDWSFVRRALILLIITAALMLLTDAIQSLSDWIRTAQSELVQNHIRNLVHQQSTTLDLSFFESPEYFDLLEQTSSDASNRPIALLESFGSLIQNGITLIVMGAVLLSYSLWLPLLLLASTLPAFYVVVRFDRNYRRWWQSVTPDRRWAQYYDVMLTHPNIAAEMRLFGLSRYFRPAFQKLKRGFLVERLRQMRKLTLAKSGAGLVALVISGSAMLWMAWRALHGHATLGDLALFYQAFSRGQSLMRLLLGSVGQIISNSLYLANLFAYLELKPKIVAPEKPVPAPTALKQGIEFRNLTFNYPGSERAALRNFSLSIPAGKIVAIVGVNGAGKTTILKLLCRFYDPQAGSIELDGINVRDLAPKELWRLITVLFQFPVQYHASGRQNIAMGDLSVDMDMANIEAAAKSAGAHETIMRLPQGYDSVLGKQFLNGAELSGGEWQRVALARAYIRSSQIILLDEPTSFMDSWAEADWFSRFRTLAQDRTGIIITHRFTIAMRADIIHVMDDGQIIESGTHAELLARGGFYAQSWMTQMQTTAGEVSDHIDSDPTPRHELELEEVESA